MITNARFTGSAGECVYGASWSGGPLRVYAGTPGIWTSDPLNLPDADLLDVSVNGEFALMLDVRHPIGWERIGTLATAQPGGMAPREILEDVLTYSYTEEGFCYESLGYNTGNMAKITPVKAIEDKNYQIGPVTRRLHDMYWDWAVSNG